jgi:hypothetical protein
VRTGKEGASPEPDRSAVQAFFHSEGETACAP